MQNFITQKRKPNPRNYWTLKRCKEDALTYESRLKWQKKSNSAYNSARKNNWLEECCSHMKPLGNKHKRQIYYVLFPKENDGQRIYVGLTGNFPNRKNNHLTSKISPVYKYMIKFNLKPTFKILTDFLTPSQAQKKEKYYQKKYNYLGYIPLHSKKAGALGGNTIKWFLETCKKAALKYNTRTEFSKKDSAGYKATQRNGWLDECCSHMITPRNLRTLKRCKESALKYNTRNEWRINDSNLYRFGLMNGWVDECCSHMELFSKPKNYWTLEKCKEDSLKYNTLKDWRTTKPTGGFSAAQRNGWLDECCSHMK